MSDDSSMQKILKEKITKRLESLNVPKGDGLLPEKILKMHNQFVEMGVDSKEALNGLLSFLDLKNEKTNPHREKIISILHESRLTDNVRSNFFDVKGKIQKWTNTLSQYGLDQNKVLTLMLKTPDLLFLGGEKFIKCINRIDEEYTKQGLSGKDFLNVYMSNPGLTGYNVETLISKIETFYQMLKPYNVTKQDLFAGIKTQSNILTIDTKEFSKKVKMILNHHRSKLWYVGGNSNETDEDALRNILRSKPVALNYNIKNLRMRRLYSIARYPEKLRASTYFNTKKECQRVIEEYLVARNRPRLLGRLYNSGYFDKPKER